jgi:hypothetical protein
MVSETRNRLPAGISKIVFLGVADAIVPQTGRRGLPATIIGTTSTTTCSPRRPDCKVAGRARAPRRTDATTGRTTEREAILRSGRKASSWIDGKEVGAQLQPRRSWFFCVPPDCR